MMKFTFDSKIGELYQTSVGHDMLNRLASALGKNPGLFAAFPVCGMSVKKISSKMEGIIGRDAFQTMLDVINMQNDRVVPEEVKAEKQWWKEAVFYQIYPRSFCDGNHDGIGDLQGIIRKLDYLKWLGIDCLWLSPIYDSPNSDNGYDIRNYRKINKEFGTMEDFDLLLKETHGRHMKLIMDLVVNHTSDEHAWFRDAVSNPDSPYRDYYFLREGKSANQPPNNWDSIFGGSAWNYYEKARRYGLHLYTAKQMDLNWDNAEVRRAVIGMVNWWLDKGVDGFRMDVISQISKPHDLPDGNGDIKKLTGFFGMEYYFAGPNLHNYLHQIKREAFEPHKAFSVGETPGIGTAIANDITNPARKELDMVFLFEHLENPGRSRFDDYQYDLNGYKRYITELFSEYPDFWPSLFFENHDNPRMVSKVEPDVRYRERVAKLLSTLLLTLRGTPFIYQGQEIGAMNQKFKSVDDLRDIESIRLYHDLISQGRHPDEAFRKVLAGSRDHARCMMPWNADARGKAWIQYDVNRNLYNVEKELNNPDSVLNYYKKLIALRKQDGRLVSGELRFTNKKLYDLFTYSRLDQNGHGYYIECNLSRNADVLPLGRNRTMEKILSNYRCNSEMLREYEANVYRV